MKESSRDDYLHVDIAPSFGTLTQESVKTMDKELKLMIGITMKKLKAIPPAQRDWKTVLATMNQNGAIKPRGAAFNKNDKYKKEENNFLKTDGSPDPAVVKEVCGFTGYFCYALPTKRPLMGRSVPGLISLSMTGMCASR